MTWKKEANFALIRTISKKSADIWKNSCSFRKQSQRVSAAVGLKMTKSAVTWRHNVQGARGAKPILVSLAAA